MAAAAVQEKLGLLGLSLSERIKRARRALAVPGNVRSHTPYFLGRNQELADLHRHVGVGKIGVVGRSRLGRSGQTELAVAYARGYADCYRLGIWSLESEGRKELIPLIGQLAFVPQFGYSPSEAEKNDAELLGQRILLELQRPAEEARRTDPDRAPSALLILDNVSEPDLLAPTSLSMLPKVDWLGIVATTRLDPKPLDPRGKQIAAVFIDALDTENALRLIRDHLPGEQFRTPQDETDAREIVRELGGFTLAVEQVAVHLGLNDYLTPGEFLAELRAKGLPSTDDLVTDETRLHIEHRNRSPHAKFRPC